MWLLLLIKSGSLNACPLIVNDSTPPITDWVTIAEEMPRFPGCEEMEGSVLEKKQCSDQRLLQYFYTNWKIPTRAREAHVCELIVISFIIDTTGKVRDIEILKDPGYGMGASVAAVLRSMNDLSTPWRPGYLKGKAVAVKYQFPIRYHLN
ncbi:MAG: energy transducer TonB [Aureispira sp.]